VDKKAGMVHKQVSRHPDQPEGVTIRIHFTLDSR
jgi:hypothetical protein